MIALIGAKAKTNAHFGQGKEPILLANLYCTGSEANLLDCNHKSCGVTSCSHANDAGVVCERKLIIVLDALMLEYFSLFLAYCTNGAIRLGDGAKLKGRVEVCINSTWHTICTHHWTAQEASVACSQLGYSPYGK